MKRNWRRFICLLAAFCLVSGLALPAYAVDGDGGAANGDIEQTVTIRSGADADLEAAQRIEEAVAASDEAAGNEAYGAPVYAADTVDPDEVIRVIVVLEEESVLEMTGSIDFDSAAVQNADQRVVRRDAALVASVERVAGSESVNRTTVLSNTVSLDCRRGDLEDLAQLPGVEAVYEAVPLKLNMVSAKDIANVVEVWEELGYTGEGVVVSVIDTGINYLHQDMTISEGAATKYTEAEWREKIAQLGYGEYMSEKVPFAWSYMRGDADVIGQATHGFHVAGIISANGDEEAGGIRGVAPDAQVLAMAVFDKDGVGGMSDDIIKAVEDSVKLGADIVNMSLGSDMGFYNNSYDLLEQTVNTASENGVLCCIAAGNANTSNTIDPDAGNVTNGLMLDDNSIVSSPALAESSLAVASFENNGGYSYELEYAINSGAASKVDALDFVARGFSFVDTEVVYCGLLPSAEELTGKIALIVRGGQTFTQKIATAAAKGAVGVIIANSAEQSVTGDEVPTNVAADDAGIPAILVSYNVGKAIHDAGSGVTVTAGLEKILTPAVSPYEASSFSSWGGSSLEIKPEVSAPGGRITSTIGGQLYGPMSGTSMATPYVAGVEALVLQYLRESGCTLTGKDLTDYLKLLVMNTAVPQMDITNYSELANVIYSVRMQGAGMINAKAAVSTTVTATVNGEPTVELKEIGQSASFTVRLENFGDTDATFSVPAAQLYTDYTDPGDYTYYMRPISGGVVMASQNQVTVPARGSVELGFTLALPGNTEIDAFVEGFVSFDDLDENGADLSLPLLAYYGDWNAEPVMDGYEFTGDSTWVTYQDMPYGSQLMDSAGYGLGWRFGLPEDPDAVSFSPNGDGVFDAVGPWLIQYRSAKTVRVQVLDENRNVIRTIADLNCVSRLPLNEMFLPQYLNTGGSSATWDGKVYDPATGAFNYVPDGQYYIEVVSEIDYEGAEAQSLVMPVKVDTEPPVVDARVELRDGKYCLVFSISDNVMIEDRTYFALNAYSWIFWVRDGESCLYDETAGEYVFTLPQQHIKFGTNTLTAYFNDSARNPVQVDIEFNTADSVDNVTVITNFADPGRVKIVDGQALVEGFAPADYTVKVNDADAALDGGYWSAYVPLGEPGASVAVRVQGFDAAGGMTFDESYSFVPDLTAPVLTLVPEAGMAERVQGDEWVATADATYPMPIYIYFSDNVGVDISSVNASYVTGYEGSYLTHHYPFFDPDTGTSATDQLYYDREKGCYVWDLLLHPSRSTYSVEASVSDYAGNRATVELSVWDSYWQDKDFLKPELTITPDMTKVTYHPELSAAANEQGYGDAYIIQDAADLSYTVTFSDNFAVRFENDEDTYVGVMAMDIMAALTGSGNPYPVYEQVILDESMCEVQTDADTGVKTYTYTYTPPAAAYGYGYLTLIAANVTDTSGNFTPLNAMLCTEDTVPLIKAVLGIESTEPGPEISGGGAEPSAITMQPVNFSRVSGCNSSLLDENGQFPLQGVLVGETSVFQINGEDVTVTNGAWTHPIDIKPGDNKVHVYIEDSGGNVYMDVVYRVIYTDPPVIVPAFRDLNANGVEVSNSAAYTLQAEIQGGVDFYSITVNGEHIFASNTFTFTTEHAFETVVQLKEGMNYITVAVSDIIGQVTQAIYPVIYEPAVTPIYPDPVPQAPSPTQPVTGTVVTDDGYTVVTVTEPDGGRTITVTSPEGELVAEITIPAVMPAPQTSFSDVPAGHWAEEAINTMAALGLVEGVAEGLFDMGGEMTRGAATLILYRLSGKPAVESAGRFTDVVPGVWYADAVEWAAKWGIVNGKTDERFAPEEPITREQMCAILCRYATLIGLDTEADAAALSAFTDAAQVSGWAVQGAAWCAREGIVQGKSGGILDPHSNVTRAEVAVILLRFITLLGE